MIREFRASGLYFRYPETWSLEREDNDHGWTVSLISGSTAFLTLNLDTDFPDSEDMLEAALAALREDYPDLEADETAEMLGGKPAIGHDINFFSFDLTNTCWTRSFDTRSGTVLMLCQTSDLDLAKEGPILRAICESMQVES